MIEERPWGLRASEQFQAINVGHEPEALVAEISSHRNVPIEMADDVIESEKEVLVDADA